MKNMVRAMYSRRASVAPNKKDKLNWPTLPSYSRDSMQSHSDTEFALAVHTRTCILLTFRFGYLLCDRGVDKIKLTLNFIVSEHVLIDVPL